MSFTAPKFTGVGRQLHTRVLAGDMLTFTTIKLGDGTMTTYEIFSGVMLAFNDFRMERYRMQNSPESKAENPFTDVKADAYYANAVLWAVENGVTTGASATTFDPAGDCTRGQIVTFLYRCLSK